MRRPLLLAAAAAVLCSASLSAQDVPADSAPPPPGPQKGAWSLSFVAPGYTAGERAEVGIWEMVGRRTNLGVTLEVSVYGSDREDNNGEQAIATTALSLGVNARQYLALGRPVVPFLQGRLYGRGGYTRRDGSGGGEDVYRTTGAGLEAGLGAEWFPWRHVSLSGHTGVRLSTSVQEQTSEDAQGNEYETTVREDGFQTFTSALGLQIYF